MRVSAAADGEGVATDGGVVGVSGPSARAVGGEAQDPNVEVGRYTHVAMEDLISMSHEVGSFQRGPLDSSHVVIAVTSLAPVLSPKTTTLKLPAARASVAALTAADGRRSSGPSSPSRRVSIPTR